MADLVFQNSNGNDVTTSLIVAQVFGKEHKNVVRDIENLYVQKILIGSILSALPTRMHETENRPHTK